MNNKIFENIEAELDILFNDDSIDLSAEDIDDCIIMTEAFYRVWRRQVREQKFEYESIM